MTDPNYSQAAQHSAELSAQAAFTTAEATRYLIELLKYFAAKFQPNEGQEHRLIGKSDPQQVREHRLIGESGSQEEQERRLIGESDPQEERDSRLIGEREQKPEIKIRIGSKNVFVGRLGERPSTDLVDAKALERIKTAIVNPAESKGVVNVLFDDEVVYRVRNGVVSIENIDRNSLQAVVASLFNDIDPEPTEVAEGSQSTTIANKPESQTAPAIEESAIPLTLADIQTLIHSELVGVKAELDRVNARLAHLESKIESGELVPATQVAARYLDSLPQNQINLGINRFNRYLDTASTHIRTMRSQVGSFLQQRQERLTQTFAERVTQPLRKVQQAVATNSATVAIKTLGSEAFHRAATQDIVQKANVLLSLQGDSRDGETKFSDRNFRIAKDETSLEIVRKSDNSSVVQVSNGRVAHSDVSLKDLVAMGVTALEAAQREVAARRTAQPQQNQVRPVRQTSTPTLSRGR